MIKQINEIPKHCVLFISDLDVWSMGQNKGGPALSRSLLAYAQAGWQVVFVTGNGKDSGQMLSGARIVRFDAPWLKRWFNVRRLGFIARALWWLYFQIMAFFLAVKLKRKYSFSIVYGYEIMGVPIANALSRFWRIPLVHRFQGTSFGVGWSNSWVKYIRAWEHWFALRMPADLIIMTDDGTQGDRVLRKLGVDMSKVRFWMNGTDKEECNNLPSKGDARMRLGLKHGNVILMVSRLVMWKCVDRAIYSLPLVLEEFPDTLLVIVGDGDEKVTLEQLANHLKVGDHVLFIGSITHKEVQYYLAAADIFLSLYSWSNVGNPLLEAMLAGKCIVTLANGDTPRIIKHDFSGVLLDEDNLSLLPGILISLLRDPLHIAALGENARRYAMENFFTWEQRLSREINEVSQLLSLYNKSRCAETVEK